MPSATIARGNEPRGRAAESPRSIPWAGWKDVLRRVKDEVRADHLSIIAAGVAFYALLSIVPALAAIISIYALVADPATVQEQIATLSGIMPSSARDFLDDQLTRLSAQSGGALGLGVLLGVAISIWSANKGTKALIESMNIAYDEEEGRGFAKKNGISLLLTFGAILGAILALTFVVGAPALLGNLGLPEWGQWTVSILRWPILFGLMLVALGVVYRLGPDRDAPRWRWVSPGALLATTLWVVGSLAFSIYVENFGSYNETYGSIAAVVILLLWFFLTSFVVLLGAELNAETEHQTREDSTVGPPEPMGRRGAHAADTLG